MPRIILTAFGTGQPVVVDIPLDAELQITSGPEGSTYVTLQFAGAEQTIAVEEPPTYIYRLISIVFGRQ